MVDVRTPFRTGSSRIGERLNPLPKPEPSPTPAPSPEPTRQDDSGEEVASASH